jgi:hypothetical protein
LLVLRGLVAISFAALFACGGAAPAPAIAPEPAPAASAVPAPPNDDQQKAGDVPMSGGGTSNGGEPAGPPPPTRAGAGPAIGSSDDSSAAAAQIRAKIRACYNQALKGDPSISGTITGCTVTIGGNGTVKSVALKSEGLPPELVACIKKAIESTRLPPDPSGRDSTVSCPIGGASP